MSDNMETPVQQETEDPTEDPEILPTEKKESNETFFSKYGAEATAIIISVVALGFSIAGFYNDKQQLALTSGQVKSNVQVLGVSLLKPLPESRTPSLRISIKNVGQTAASLVAAEWDYDHGSPDPHGKGNSGTRRRFRNMGPGVEKILELPHNALRRFDLAAPHLRQRPYYFYGTVWSKDETTKEIRGEDWCYELPWITEEDLQQTALRPCDILSYRSDPNRVMEDLE